MLYGSCGTVLIPLSVSCYRYATGGSIPGLLPQLPSSALNATFSVNNTGNMFEKESMFDIDVSGSGGEYTVQAGFGWTNGIVLWAAANYGAVLSSPVCPPVNTTSTSMAMSFAQAEALEKRYRRALARRSVARGQAAAVVADVRKLEGRSAVSRKTLTLERVRKGMPGWMFAGRKAGKN